MNNITIVTAFYDIGREDWNNYDRKTSFYFECFERLCQLQNKIIVFSQEKFKPFFDEIIQNRKSNLIVIYQDIFKSNIELISKIRKSQSNLQKIGGLYDYGRPPEYWNPEYILVNFLKSYFCLSSIQMVDDIDDTLSWIDFGYVKNQNQIPESKLWKYNFSNKIHFWNILDIPDQIDIVDTIKTNTVYIQGCHIVAPKNKWIVLNNLMKKQIDRLLENKLIDDDQTLMLMSYLSNPEEFIIHNENINYQDLGWFFIFQHYNENCDSNRKEEMESRR